MGKFLKIYLPIIIVATVATIFFVNRMPEKPRMFQFVEEKMNSIITPKAPIGSLTPSRDLRGTWKSSLAGKGIQVYGKFGPVTTTLYEDGDMEIIIDSVDNNLASGKIRYTNLCAYGQTIGPQLKISVPKQCVSDTGYMPLQIKVSASSLNFIDTKVEGVAISMQGSYTTDIMTGSATITLPAYGALKGEFHLNRESK